MRKSFVKAAFISAALYAISLYIEFHACMYGIDQAYNGPYYFVEQTPELANFFVNITIGIAVVFVIVAGLICVDITRILDKKFSNR